ncbi:MAG: glycosyltransferase family 1 protein [Alphaproteobacteria bacterium]|nr:glycosyltransferase family 1 protein [Alphaproteobacteria bacterium]
MRILVITDAWHPQINGVVRTLTTLGQELTRLGHEVISITPDQFRSVPCPTYPEIRLSLLPGRKMARLIEQHQPCAIHIATEGPLGVAGRNYCVKRKLPFTTAYHTRFPEYIHARFSIPVSLTYKLIRWFHAPASAIMVATPSIENDLKARGFGNIRRWTRGVDTALFRPGPKDNKLFPWPRPISLYVGRVAVEKNIAAFLALDLPGTKVVIGDGPQMEQLKSRYPEVRFLGAKMGEELARHYRAADLFVFPSRTDTFGLVLLEALASGLPVAAYPVAGPLDVLGDSLAGCLNVDLAKASLEALAIEPGLCRAHALDFSWEVSARQFLSNLDPFDSGQAWPAPSLAAIETPAAL